MIPTIAYDGGAATALPATLPLPASNAGVKLVQGEAPDEAREFDRLLARRFARACYVFLVAYAGFLARDLVFFNRGGVEFQRYVLAAGVVLQGGLTLAVRFGRAASRGRRKVAQYATIVLAWFVLGILQYDFLRYEVTQPEVQAADWSATVQITVANTNFFPWFALIAGYPVLVPMSGRRAAVFGLGTMLIPVLVTVLAAYTIPPLNWNRTIYMHIQYAVWGTIGTCIAAYGAAQAGALRKEAFAARQFGQYILRERLGGGGMGDVFLAEHRLLKRPSVIKVIRQDRSADANLLARFEREVKILATLTHWNTVDVYDYGHTPEGTFYFVMEYLPGANLDELVKRHGPLPPGRAVFLIAQICRGLREAHAGGLIHRDIKPSNIMATERGGLQDVAKLLDFGLVFDPGRLTDSGKLTHETTILGTPHYMAPEQARGEAVDGRSDIYALGATLYFLLAGRPPFDQKAIVEVLAAHLTAVPKPLCDVNAALPGDLNAVVLRCLAKAPADRFADVRELELALLGCSCSTDWDHERAAVP
ncbi:serine/threonine-protein kinase [Limnoglobus roseus]|uniref:non-specific serine/threonine protein kinase n=1 Tax=Limnoglobus roseus TaxID=2598579 RepID=A0A5C1ANL4_9BACT|nr:serine/threonine-protein kinase [Limnoglobus roseus]QEL20831.1 serine/threonine protein kinase [Limnoglobus roseus]